MIDTQLERFRAQILTLREPEPRVIDAVPKAALLTALEDIAEIGNGGSVSLDDANHLLDLLYADIEPRLNFKVQLATLNQIQQCSLDDDLDDDARAVLRSGVMEYYESARQSCDIYNRGALCSPHSMLQLAAAIAVLTASDDAAATQAFNDLKAAAIEKCATLQWEQEKRVFSELFATIEAALSVKDEDVREVSDAVSQGWSEDEIGAILRRYRRALRGPPSRARPQSIALIDRNLVLLAQGELNSNNWKLWAEAAQTLGPRRASAALRDYVASQEGARDDRPKGKAMTRVGRVYSKVGRK